jgi:X-Pro dipeptidyl-peptidase
MRPRRTALLACAALVLPLGGIAVAAPGHTPPGAAKANERSAHGSTQADPTANGTSSGPRRSVAAEPGTATDGTALPDLDVVDPVRYSLDDAVVEHVRVPSRNGIDTIWVDIIRPATEPGVELPTILNASPYYNTLGRGWEGHCKTPTGTTLPPSPGAPGLGNCGQTPFPEFYDEYFVPRGYAVALMDVRGTRNSSGCQVYGDRDEVFDGVDVVDWIADQDWSNGKVGLTGGSYDGTIANGVAVEQPISGRHPDAVSAIVPLRSIGRWYDYHFFNGVASQGHAATPALFTAALAGMDNPTSGDALGAAHLAQRKACIPTMGLLTDAGYAPTYQDAEADFWAERDFVKDAASTKAAVFMVHGLYDFNVKTNNVGHFWQALPQDAPKKLWLFNGDHADTDTPDEETARAGGKILPFTFQQAYREGVHRWWAQFLKGIEAGALDTPAAEVQQGDGTWLGSRTWPAPSVDEVLSLAPDGAAVAGPAESGTATWSDQPAGGTARTAFVTEPVARETRLSGQVVLDLLYRLQGPDTTIAVRIDDLPPDASDTAAATDRVHDGDVTGPLTISYAYARAFYRDSIVARGVSTPTDGSPVPPGSEVRTSFGSLPFDHVLRPGHRLRFTFSASDGGTLPSFTGGTVELLLGEDGSTVRLPVVR